MLTNRAAVRGESHAHTHASLESLSGLLTVYEMTIDGFNQGINVSMLEIANFDLLFNNRSRWSFVGASRGSVRIANTTVRDEQEDNAGVIVEALSGDIELARVRVARVCDVKLNGALAHSVTLRDCDLRSPLQRLFVANASRVHFLNTTLAGEINVGIVNDGSASLRRSSAPLPPSASPRPAIELRDSALLATSKLSGIVVGSRGGSFDVVVFNSSVDGRVSFDSIDSDDVDVTLIEFAHARLGNSSRLVLDCDVLRFLSTTVETGANFASGNGEQHAYVAFEARDSTFGGVWGRFVIRPLANLTLDSSTVRVLCFVLL